MVPARVTRNRNIFKGGIISMFCCPLWHKPEHLIQYCRSQRAQLIKSPTALSHATQTSSDFLFSSRFFFSPAASFVAWITDDPGMGASTAAVTICPGFGRFVFLHIKDQSKFGSRPQRCFQQKNQPLVTSILAERD